MRVVADLAVRAGDTRLAGGWRRWALGLVAASISLASAGAMTQLGQQPGSGLPGGAFGPPGVSSSVVTETIPATEGKLRGVRQGQVVSFKGAPFAAPPVGELRWRPPQPAAPWKGVRDADRYARPCPQPQARQPTSEDCLYLNLWTPAARAKRVGLPVMVWIHGGGFAIGTGGTPGYDGTHFAERGVVLVTLNYRLGRLGFFVHPALTREQPAGPLGNYGLMDQIAALKWVQANIAAFGGDPRNVTIFGESAGGVCVAYLMASPAARGLFAKAIIESAGGRIKAASLADAQGAGAAFAEQHGIRGDDAATARALRALPVASLLAGAEGTTSGGPMPMVDGAIVSEPIPEAFAAGHQARVPLLEGANSWESSLFANLPQDPERVLQQTDPDRATALRLYGPDPVKAATDIMTDAMVTEPARFLARRMAEAGAPVFVYRFAYVPARRRASAPGAGHGDEIAYVFGNLGAPEADETSAPPAAPQADRRISDAMIAYWVAFARTGDPGGAGGVAWPRYTPGGDEILEFGDDGVRAATLNKARLDWLAGRADHPIEP